MTSSRYQGAARIACNEAGCRSEMVAVPRPGTSTAKAYRVLRGRALEAGWDLGWPSYHADTRDYCPAHPRRFRTEAA